MAVGRLTANAFPVLLYSHPQKREGENENGLVLVDRGIHRKPHRYVVWRWIDDPEYGIHYALGYFTDDFDLAFADWLERSGLDSGNRFIQT